MGTDARFGWIIETIGVRAGDRVLEIGAGSSPSVAYLAEAVGGGQVVAVDRSATAVARSRRKHAHLVDSGKVRLVQVAVEELRPGDVLGGDGRRFDKVLAVNVNLFWTRRPTAELALIRELLGPGGTLSLVYGYGDPTDSVGESPKPLPGKLSGYLAEAGYMVRTYSSGDLLCVTATPEGAPER
ncbi:class I SAM-dependent methyltransferase [Nocardia sp. CDC141]|uniref:Class I SAM-dependent methyltransferase n=1 Tax=Nocardia pulmonis TaxID=2951408 RepID=A0A9X2IWD1_9NOCA|nr:MULTISPECIES: class I SAM-dependent methyltransferase [Nocardia]MCM6774817.1 class I SAM-dependent methyltransferase [Nocardia pulmonis]